MPPSATPAILSPPNRGAARARRECSKPDRKGRSRDSAKLEIFARNLDHYCPIEPLLTRFFEGVGAGIVNQAERMRPLRPNSSLPGRQSATIADDGQLGAFSEQPRFLGGRENGQ